LPSRSWAACTTIIDERPDRPVTRDDVADGEGSQYKAVATGRLGHPGLVLPETVLLAHVTKSHNGRHLVDVTRRVVYGTAEAVANASAATRGGTPPRSIPPILSGSTRRSAPRWHP